MTDTLSAVVATLRAAGCVFAEDEADLLITAAAGPAELAAMIDRRVAGDPLEQILGWAGFGGLRIAIDPGVFVPRQRTEFLAEQARDRLRRVTGRSPVAVDLCCGSGAIGAVLLTGVPGLDLYAADVDPAAVACARRNLEPLGGRVYQGDMDAPLPDRLRGRVDVLVANAPYVPTGEIALMPPEARDHEPPVALDGGADGLDLLRRVIALAPDWLAPGGSVLVETSERQAPALSATILHSGLSPRVVSCDDMGTTVLIGISSG